MGLRYLDDHRIMMEMAGGATMSVIYEGLLKEAVPGLTESSIVVMIACGGPFFPRLCC
jgi:ABC-type methionine transport system permease subunit